MRPFAQVYRLFGLTDIPALLTNVFKDTYNRIHGRFYCIAQTENWQVLKSNYCAFFRQCGLNNWLGGDCNQSEVSWRHIMSHFLLWVLNIKKFRSGLQNPDELTKSARLSLQGRIAKHVFCKASECDTHLRRQCNATKKQMLSLSPCACEHAFLPFLVHIPAWACMQSWFHISNRDGVENKTSYFVFSKNRKK